jgi:hypothetical protein
MEYRKTVITDVIAKEQKGRDRIYMTEVLSKDNYNGWNIEGQL